MYLHNCTASLFSYGLECTSKISIESYQWLMNFLFNIQHVQATLKYSYSFINNHVTFKYLLIGWKCNILNNKGCHLNWHGDSEKMFNFLLWQWMDIRRWIRNLVIWEVSHIINHDWDQFTSRLNSYRINFTWSNWVVLDIVWVSHDSDCDCCLKI